MEFTESQQYELSGGVRRLTLTPEQRDRLRRLQAQESAGQAANIRRARHILLDHFTARLDTLEIALRAVVDGKTEEARELLRK